VQEVADVEALIRSGAPRPAPGGTGVRVSPPIVVPAGASERPRGDGARRIEPGSYADLKRCIVERGLLAPQPGYYTGKLLTSATLLTLSLTALVLLTNPWLQVLNATVLAFSFGQLAFLAHDAGHHQIVHRGWFFPVLTLTLGNLLLGVSAQWWTAKHNAHHSHPNQDNHDPDIDIPVLAFTEAQARAMRGPQRIIGAYQAYWLVPLFMFQALSMRVMSTLYLLQRCNRRACVELALMALHLVLHCWLLLLRHDPLQALGLFSLTQALFGVYLASAFAPNHKGMPVLTSDTALDFLPRQVLTARNVRGHWLTDFCLGGLNYQIEHHLFPSMPRNRLREAARIIRAFCEAHELPYCETPLWRSYGEVVAHLNRMSRIVRAPRST
jgi:fatty acid desaturase